MDIKGLVMFMRVLRCIREPRGWCPYPHGWDRVWQMTVSLGIREGADEQFALVPLIPLILIS